MLRGLTVIILLLGNLLRWGTPVMLGGVVKFAVQMTAPRSRLRTRVILALASLAERWVAGNDRIFDRLLPTRWDIQGIGKDVQPSGHYLIISNHVSWVDIFVLFRAFHGRAAFIRFFLKRELIWLPIAGQGCWALEFPFMRRNAREKDLEATRRACQRYKNFPVAIANFVEGTRFTRAKRDAQQSPYRHLLRPRAGGIGFVFASMSNVLDAVYDVTIAYPHDEVTMWQFITGRVERITVRARRVEPPASPDGVREWIDGVWREKDALLESLARSRA
jgi:1-acyl-sn-glycerol-3-phosphate acyltransferase